MQDEVPMAFYSRKQNTAQKQYITTERESCYQLLNLQGIQEYFVRLPLTHHSLYRP
jgi:hypothetical protein